MNKEETYLVILGLIIGISIGFTIDMVNREYLYKNEVVENSFNYMNTFCKDNGYTYPYYISHRDNQYYVWCMNTHGNITEVIEI